MSSNTVVVLTALDLEYQAVRQRMTYLDARYVKGTRFETGHLMDGRCRIALGLVGVGNHPAAVLAERAMNEFDPVAVLFVGVAGGLRTDVALGDVVVATKVYAYHGATSDDDGMKARPQVWQIPHAPEQVARHLARTGEWTHDLVENPTVRFGPIAAGEVVQYSTTGATAAWLQAHYNDAVAIEMEGAGAAQAGHLNDSLPVVVVRGISDNADSGKSHTDATGWQPLAAKHAAAFALALADALTKGSTNTRSRTRPDRSPPMTSSFQNIANGNAHVGIQVGQVHGDVHVRDAAPATGDPGQQLKELRTLLRDAYDARNIDEPTYREAEAEVRTATEATDRGARLRALKKLGGLVGDVSQLASAVAAVVALLGNLQ